VPRSDAISVGFPSLEQLFSRLHLPKSTRLVGTVEEVGPNVGGDFKKGDRVAGVTQGCNAFNLEEGAFAEYAIIKEGGLFKVPENVKDEEAATVGLAFATVGLGLYQTLSLPWPGTVPANCPVLIYGGSSATGSIAIQFAKL